MPTSILKHAQHIVDRVHVTVIGTAGALVKTSVVTTATKKVDLVFTGQQGTEFGLENQQTALSHPDHQEKPANYHVLINAMVLLAWDRARA
jgi:hypothetical protein